MAKIERLRLFVRDLTGAVRRQMYVRETGEVKTFVSGYSNSVVPSLWDRSAEARTA